MITANNVFPRGSSSVHFDGVVRSSVTNKRFHWFYPWMLVFQRNCSENLVSSNHISETIGTQYLRPSGVTSVVIHIVSGRGNYIANNHIAATTDVSNAKDGEVDSYFSAQMDALMTADQLMELDVTATLGEKSHIKIRFCIREVRNRLLWTGRKTHSERLPRDRLHTAKECGSHISRIVQTPRRDWGTGPAGCLVV